MFQRMCSAAGQGATGEIPGAELARAPCLGKEEQVLFLAIEESSILTEYFLVSGPHLNVKERS